MSQSRENGVTIFHLPLISNNPLPTNNRHRSLGNRCSAVYQTQPANPNEQSEAFVPAHPNLHQICQDADMSVRGLRREEKRLDPETLGLSFRMHSHDPAFSPEPLPVREQYAQIRVRGCMKQFRICLCTATRIASCLSCRRINEGHREEQMKKLFLLECSSTRAAIITQN